MSTPNMQKHVCLYVRLHPEDAKKVMELCDKYGIEPRDFISIGTMRYVDNIETAREAPPGHGPSDLLLKRKHG